MGAPEARKGHAPSHGPGGVWGRPAHLRAHAVPADATSRLGRRVTSTRACPSCAVGLSPPRGAWPSWAPSAGPRRCRRSVWPSGPTSASRWPSRGPCEQAEGGEWGAPGTPAPPPPGAVGQPTSCPVPFHGGALGGDAGGRTVAQGPKRQGVFWSFLILPTLPSS